MLIAALLKIKPKARISLDGPQEIHSHHRTQLSNKKHTKAWMKLEEMTLSVRGQPSRIPFLQHSYNTKNYGD